MTRVLIFLVAALALVQSAAATPAGFVLPERPHYSEAAKLEAYRTVLYREHIRCGETATETFLGWEEVSACSEVYLRLKLSFMNGVTLERFRNMPVKTKAMAHDKGYAAFRAWVHRQSVQVAVD